MKYWVKDDILLRSAGRGTALCQRYSIAHKAWVPYGRFSDQEFVQPADRTLAIQTLLDLGATRQEAEDALDEE